MLYLRKKKIYFADIFFVINLLCSLFHNKFKNIAYSFFLLTKIVIASNIAC